MTKIVAQKLYPLCKAAVTPKGFEPIKKKMIGFIDSHVSTLQERGPFSRLFMQADDRSFLLEAVGVTDDQVRQVIKETKLIGSHWKALNDPFAFVALCCVKALVASKKLDDARLVNLYMTLHLYAMYHARYFKFVQRETMEYTVNSLSNKHDLKQYGTVLTALQKKADGFLETYEKGLSSDDDKKFIDYIMNLNTRINQWMKGLMNEYMKNREAGKFFNTEKESFDEDDYRETSNTSLEIARLSTTIARKVISSPVDYKIVKLCAKITDVPESSLHSTVNDIRKGADSDKMRDVVNLCLVIFLVDEKAEPREIQSERFINSMLLVYNRSNTVDPNVLKLKEILDELLSRHSDKYLRTNRLATKINWRKAVFMYSVFSIQQFYGG